MLSVIECGSITEASRRLGRTQPAITLQIHRLEELVGKTLFTYDGRRMSLTPDGSVVATYAKSILRLHDELLARMSSPEIEGNVVLGTPDLYAAFMLPAILRIFKKAFPRIKVELRCSLSTPLVEMIKKRTIDVAVVTRMNDFTGGQVVRREQLLWMTGDTSEADAEDPVPLGLLPVGNIYRDHALDALERIGRRWRIVCESESVGGLQAAAFAGMAVIVLGRSALVPGMREVSNQHFPQLPQVDLLLYKSQGPTSLAANALHDYLAHYLALGDEGPRAGLPFA